MEVIHGKKLYGLSRADGTHWYWGDQEVAVIDPVNGEIEWNGRKFQYPSEVILSIRGKKPAACGTWKIEARRVSQSATQGSIVILIDGKILMAFNDDKILDEHGNWVSTIKDEELGRLVCSALWNPFDSTYHYSEKAKTMFYKKIR